MAAPGASVPEVEEAAGEGAAAAAAGGGIQARLVRASVHTSLRAGSLREAAVEAARAELAARLGMEVVVQVVSQAVAKPFRVWIDVVYEAPAGTAILECGGPPMSLPGSGKDVEAVAGRFVAAAAAVARSLAKRVDG